MTSPADQNPEPQVLVVLVQLDGVDPGGLPRTHPGSEPLLPATDLGIVRGDGAFESLLVHGGRPRKVDSHLARLARSQEMLDIDGPSTETWREAIEFAAQQWTHDGPGLLRLILTRGPEAGGTPTAYITVEPEAPYLAGLRENGIALMTQQRGYSVDLSAEAPWQLLGAKTLSYVTNMASQRYAKARGFDDVLYLSAEGECLEGPRSTLVIARDGELVSPPTDIGILAGTTLDALTEVAGAEGIPVRRERLLVTDLIAADGVWMVSSVARALRANRIDEAELATGPTIDVEGLVDRALEIDAP